jgi:hypothetical protein
LPSPPSPPPSPHSLLPARLLISLSSGLMSSGFRLPLPSPLHRQHAPRGSQPRSGALPFAYVLAGVVLPPTHASLPHLPPPSTDRGYVCQSYSQPLASMRRTPSFVPLLIRGARLSISVVCHTSILTSHLPMQTPSLHLTHLAFRSVSPLATSSLLSPPLYTSWISRLETSSGALTGTGIFHTLCRILSAHGHSHAVALVPSSRLRAGSCMCYRPGLPASSGSSVLARGFSRLQERLSPLSYSLTRR